MKSTKIWSPQNLQYSINAYTTINTPYNWPAFLTASCLNIDSGYIEPKVGPIT